MKNCLFKRTQKLYVDKQTQTGFLSLPLFLFCSRTSTHTHRGDHLGLLSFLTRASSDSLGRQSVERRSITLLTKFIAILFHQTPPVCVCFQTAPADFLYPVHARHVALYQHSSALNTFLSTPRLRGIASHCVPELQDCLPLI